MNQQAKALFDQMKPEEKQRFVQGLKLLEKDGVIKKPVSHLYEKELQNPPKK